MLKSIYIKCVNGGNMKKKDIFDFEKYQSKKALENVRSLAQINPKYGTFLYTNKNEEDTNEAIGIYYNIGKYSFNKIAKMIMFITMAKEPFFDQLRTKEQLGYLVRCSNHNFLNTYGIIQEIQSSIKDCDYLEKRIKDFNKDFHKELKSFDSEMFKTYQETVVNMIMEKEDNISELLARLIKEVLLEKYVFNRREKIKEAVLKLEVEDVYKFSKKYIMENKDVIIIKNHKK
jgi:secreted Zn-dependent insulinase-like peptidase